MLIVAVHDVAPSTLPQASWLLARLDDAGVERRVIKAIPAEPGGADPAPFEDLVRSEAARGSEVVLHGWTHRAGARYRGSAIDRVRARLFAADAAEFLTLTPSEMRSRLDAGRAWLDRLGLAARGFCPPAWLAAPGLAAAARAAGFRYVLTLRGLRDLSPPPGTASRIDLPATGYMATGAVQEALLRLGGAILFRPLAVLLEAPAVRIYLHPHGASSSPDCARVLREIELLARTRRAGTYAELLRA